MPELVDRLGPVASTSLRLASRFSNILRAGDPVEELAQIHKCGTVLISAANPAVFVDRMLASGLDWTGVIVLICDTELGSEELHRLAAAGAHTGSFSPVEGFDQRLFLVEGDSRALAAAKRIVEDEGARPLRIERHRKSLYTAGLSIAHCLALPMVAACAESLRASGLPQNFALDVTERAFQRTLRAYRKGGRKGWEGPLPRKEIASIRRNIHGLTAVNPQLAAYYAEGAASSLRLFKKDADWLDRAKPVERKRAAMAAAAS
ncbi:MAG: DUF2520 domain-containing protein [Bryobacteraceae bacterium]|nr:DUF2520 domain-containing protein [Bryobacteraceae bacterium]